MSILTDEQLISLAANYLDAALNKIEVAEFHEQRLSDRLRSDTARRVEVQAYFEGVLYAGVAATDQLAETINRSLRLGLDRPNLNGTLRAAAQADFDEAVGLVLADLGHWRQRQNVREAGAVRRRATHHYYPKKIRYDTWQYEASDGLGVEEGGGVGLLAAAYVSDLRDLRTLIRALAAMLGVEGPLDNLRDGG